MSRILMVSSEAAPFAKTGGLSDVVGVLPKALTALGHQVAVLLPRYAQTRPFRMRRIWGELPIAMGGRIYFSSLFQSEEDETFLFLDFPEFYDRDGLYGDRDGDYPGQSICASPCSPAAHSRWRAMSSRRQILHCHDWQAGLASALPEDVLAYDPTFCGTRTLTDHPQPGLSGLFSPDSSPGNRLDASCFPAGLESSSGAK